MLTLPPMKYEGNWKGFDRGREGIYRRDAWSGVLEVLAENEGTLITDTRSKMYKELKKRYPNTVWISSKDKDHNYFRDYQTAWTLTGVLEPTRPTKGIVTLTRLGRAFVDGRVSLNGVWTQAMACHEEKNGERSFAVLASAFLALGKKKLSLGKVFYGIERNWRPADGLPIKISLPKKATTTNRTAARRLRSMLNLLTSVGALQMENVRNETNWTANNTVILQAIADRAVITTPIAKANRQRPDNSDATIEEELARFAEFRDSKSAPIRKMVMRSIAIRRGQPRFRRMLLGLYARKCAISRWDAPIALEAAHISPIALQGDHDPSNGILLRADLHTLFDLHYVAVDPATFAVVLSQKLKNTMYAGFSGQTLHLPISVTDQPSKKALAEHYRSLVRS